MSALDVSVLNPILKDLYDNKKKSNVENKQRFSRIRRIINRKPKKTK